MLRNQDKTAEATIKRIWAPTGSGQRAPQSAPPVLIELQDQASDSGEARAGTQARQAAAEAFAARGPAIWGLIFDANLLGARPAPPPAWEFARHRATPCP